MISIRRLPPWMKLECRLSFSFYAPGSFSQKIEDTALSSNWLQFGGRKNRLSPPPVMMYYGEKKGTPLIVRNMNECIWLTGCKGGFNWRNPLSLPLSRSLPCPSVSCLFVALSRCFSLILRWARTGSFLRMHYLQYSALGCARSFRRRGSA